MLECVIATMRISGENYKANKGIEFPLIESKLRPKEIHCVYVLLCRLYEHNL